MGGIYRVKLCREQLIIFLLILTIYIVIYKRFRKVISRSVFPDKDRLLIKLFFKRIFRFLYKEEVTFFRQELVFDPKQ